MTEPIVIDMAPFRELVKLGMPDTFELRRTTSTRTDAGGWTDTPATVAAGPCRLAASGVPGQGSSAERVIAERLGWITFYTVTLPLGITINPTTDTLIVNGVTFEIGGTIGGDGAWDVQQTAIVRREQ